MKKELIIKNKDNIIVIRRKQVYKLIHEKEQYIEGFITTSSLNGDPVAPVYHFPESYYVVLQNGDKHILNKEQYKELKGWFK